MSSDSATKLISVRNLLVNADDFGLTPGVNRSVVELHRARALSSATLMATGAFFDDAVALARADPSLEVGCHILLVDGNPALPPEQIPTLCPNGQSFRPSLARFVADLFAFRIRASEVQAEATAQIRRLQTAGLRVSHIDTHKHTHLFSGILRPLLAAARACQVPAVRNPFEPAWALRATPAANSTSFRLRRLAVTALRSKHRGFHRTVSESGLATTSGTIGVLATGTLNVEETLRNLLAAIASDPTQTWELVCHPGYPDTHLDQVRTRLRASRAQEHAALLKLVPAIPLTSWRDLESSAAANQLH
ncbi:MAG: ChbG/HpnK family deacetylase [Acidobacteriaceae bacterium]